MAYHIKVKARNVAEAEGCPSLSEAILRRPREIALVAPGDDCRLRVIGVFDSRPKRVQLRIDGTLPESMKPLVNVLVHEIDSQCKQPTGGPGYWSGRLWRWFFAKVSPGIVAAILAPLLMGAVLFVRAWFAG
ncbi:hypothetical protein [Nonomuraea glycinis]|uniref:hypothetical protein n=1 Tax=Nonomuraea glycinis TaxID=2047744 RepID=UPI002E13E509|nr:hypothetical protein OHA68_16035 [Nonomuraea glycinis]